VHTAKQAQLLKSRLGVPVEHAMRYGEPGIAPAFERLKQCDVTVIPLYPQYSESATESVADKLPPGVRMIREFHAHPAYIAALAANVRRHWQTHGRGPLLLMSFHGLPKRGGELYQKQCIATATLLAEKLELKQKDWRVTFQSRFGYAEWLQPYTQPSLEALARAGCERVDVVCPGFVADCLETLEEIGIMARRAFLAAGGKQLNVLPCLNEAPEWIDALAAIVNGR
jgi:ferrochelatase